MVSRLFMENRTEWISFMGGMVMDEDPKTGRRRTPQLQTTRFFLQPRSAAVNLFQFRVQNSVCEALREVLNPLGPTDSLSLSVSVFQRTIPLSPVSPSHHSGSPSPH